MPDKPFSEVNCIIAGWLWCKMSGMEKLIVDKDGRITIPPHILAKRGLRPGDELALVEAAEGLLVYQAGVDEDTSAWWHSLSGDERRIAEGEARAYEALDEAERDRVWNESDDSLDKEAEGDEVDLPAK